VNERPDSHEPADQRTGDDDAQERWPEEAAGASSADADAETRTEGAAATHSPAETPDAAERDAGADDVAAHDADADEATRAATFADESDADDDDDDDADADADPEAVADEEAAERDRFAEFMLPEPLLQAIDDLGFHYCTPIQSGVLPYSLSDYDVTGQAQTGTGKTAAFLITILTQQYEFPLRSPNPPGTPRALVLAPTRELAIQIEQDAQLLGKHLGSRILNVVGGMDLNKQRMELNEMPVDILVATPGRLIDFMQRRVIDLSRVEILVIDEADRMLDMGFWPDVRRILASLPVERQTMLFSATLSPRVDRVAGPIMKDPVRVQVAPSAQPIEAISQAVYPVNGLQKNDLLVRLLEERRLDKVLVFTRTKHRADKVCRHLERSRISGAAIHSNRSQIQRQRALDGFKNGMYRVLVATDIVARGIDVDGISHVINYDLPVNAQDYVHRIGRTARAGASGTAISFLAAEEAQELRAIEVLIGSTLPAEDVEGFGYHERLIPNPQRTATRAPRVVYGGRRDRRGSARPGARAR
jgi:superfamily II DNA/RNA helicase